MSFFHKVAAVSGITAGQIVSVKASMSAEKTFLYLGLPTVNQILYQADIDKGTVEKQMQVTAMSVSPLLLLRPELGRLRLPDASFLVSLETVGA